MSTIKRVFRYKKIGIQKGIVYLILLIFFQSFLSCSERKDFDDIKFSISYLKDLESKVSINNVFKKKFSTLKRSNLGTENVVFWFKITLLDTIKSQNILFKIDRNTANEISIFDQFKQIPYKDLNQTSPLLLVQHKKQTSTYFLRVKFNKQVYFKLHLKKFDLTQETEKYIFFKNGMYYGFVAMVILINMFFFSSLKDKTFLYYCLFLFSTTISFSIYDGILNSLIKDTFIIFVDLLMHFCVALFGAIFAHHFLDLNRYKTKSYILTSIFLLITLSSYLLFIITQKNIFFSLGDTFGIITLFYCWTLGLSVYKKHEFAKFFVIGYSLILFFGIFFLAPVNWGLPIPSVSLDTVKFSSLFEVLILMYAMTYRIKILKEENQKFRGEINVYLRKIQALQIESGGDNEISENTLITKFDLSKREAEVLLLISKGLTNKRIAVDLNISLNTIKYHIRNIYEKLNINSKNEAIDIFSEINKIQKQVHKKIPSKSSGF